LRLFRAQHESLPDLFAGHRFHEWIERVVDLDEVFEIQNDSFLGLFSCSAGPQNATLMRLMPA
jgi:hypothetical protein